MSNENTDVLSQVSKQRNIVITIILILLIGWNLLATASYIFSYAGYVEPEQAGQFDFLKAAIITTLNALFIGAILFWKKIGAHGLLAIGVYAFLSNSTRLGVAEGIINTLPVIIIFLLLFIGGKKKIWPQLS